MSLVGERKSDKLKDINTGGHVFLLTEFKEKFKSAAPLFDFF